MPPASLVAAAFVAVALFARPAPAYGIGEPGDRTFEVLLYSIPALVEVALPDVRLELNEQRPSAVLSWPAHLRLWDAGGIRYTPHTTLAAPRAELTAFLEPQLAFGEPWALRGLAGARVFGGLPLQAGLVGALLEGGGLVGSDGHGGFVGGGIAIGTVFDRNFPMVALVARRTWTTTGPRVDVSLDVVLALPPR